MLKISVKLNALAFKKLLSHFYSLQLCVSDKHKILFVPEKALFSLKLFREIMKYPNKNQNYYTLVSKL